MLRLPELLRGDACGPCAHGHVRLRLALCHDAVYDPAKRPGWAGGLE